MIFESHLEQAHGNRKTVAPFGMALVGRTFSAGSAYRYGFNGKEDDKDISEGGQDYGLRINDKRLGKFLSVDPITNKYPELTPYQFASNRPIDGIDQDGLEWMKYIPKISYDNSWTDYPSAVVNGLANVGNLVPEIWNSGVKTVKSLQNGTYIKDLTGEMKATGVKIKAWTAAEITLLKKPIGEQFKQDWETLKNPYTLEAVVTFVAPIKLPAIRMGVTNLAMESAIFRTVAQRVDLFMRYAEQVPLTSLKDGATTTKMLEDALKVIDKNYRNTLTDQSVVK